MPFFHETQKGTKLALGIVLLWIGGFALFIAFETNPKSASAPKTVGELAGVVATSVQSGAYAAGQSSASASSAAQSQYLAGG